MPVTSDGQQIVYPSDAEAGVDYRRLAAENIYEQEVWTFSDAVEHVLDVFDVPRDARNSRIAMRAVLKASRNLPTLHDWPCYRRLLVVNTVAAYSTGTIAFDFTGGTYERMVTLTTGTWPTWAGFGNLRVSGVDYPVLQRVSDTVLTLDTRRCPGADVAAGTAYTVYRNKYPLPNDFRRSDRIIETSTRRELAVVSAGLAQVSNVMSGGTSNPFVSCIVEDENYLSGFALMLAPAINSANSVSFLYQRKMRPLVTQLYDTGTVAITADSASVTGTGTAFTERMIGAILRVSPNADAPTPLVGSIASTEPNPATYQRVIMGVSDGTTLLVDETLGESASGRAFTISDPVDVTDLMIDAFLRLAELEFARLSGREDVLERNQSFIGQLEIAREGVRSTTAIQQGTVTGDEGYSLIGAVDVTPA